jgi:hypothetical protein
MPFPAAALLWVAAVAVPVLLVLLALRNMLSPGVADSHPRAIVRSLPDWPVRGALATAIRELDALAAAAAIARTAGVPDSITRSVVAQAAVGTGVVQGCAARLAAVAEEVRAGIPTEHRSPHPSVHAVAASIRLAERLDREALRLRKLAHAAQQARLALAEMTLSSRAVDDLPAAEAALRETGRVLRELTPLYGVRAHRSNPSPNPSNVPGTPGQACGVPLRPRHAGADTDPTEDPARGGE